MSTGRTTPDLLSARRAADGATPLLTYYDDATGERTELSTVTFDNWVAKSANLLVDGLGLGPGDEAVLALPVHWQSFVVAAACWSAGLHVRTEPVVDNGSRPQVVFAAEGGAAPPTAGETVVLSLRPLGAGLVHAVPAVVDYATEVRSCGDRFAGVGPHPESPALDGQSHSHVVAAALGEPGGEGRALFAPPDDPPLDARWLLRAYLAPLAQGGSAVLCRNPDPAVLDRRRHDERAVVG